MSSAFPSFNSTMTKQKTKDPQWGVDHERFALKHKLCPAARLLWHWLMLQGELGEESEPDLKEFNNWVKKQRGKPFTRPWLKHALNQLIESRVIQLVKQYTWHLVKIVTRPLEWLKPPKKAKEKLPNRSSTYATQPSNPISSEKPEDSSNTPSDLSHQVEILTICTNAGIYYDPERPGEIFRYSLEEVRAAVEFYEQRCSYGERIDNPPGWLISCLRWKWYDQPGILSRLVSWFKGNA